MLEWFKSGKPLPKRYVWEIVLGAYEHFSNEESLVNVNVEDGVTCDVIGDVHGMLFLLQIYFYCSLSELGDRAILRLASSILFNG